MKKLIPLTLLLACSLALVRCGRVEDNDPAAAQDGGTTRDAGDVDLGGNDAGTSGGDAGTADAGTGTCSPAKNTGCAATEKCTITDLQKETVGCGAAGTKAHGQPCTSDGECGPKTLCVPVSTTQGACISFCETDADCPDASWECQIEAAPGAKLCTPKCNPVNNTGCDTNQKCTIVSGPTSPNDTRPIVFGCGPVGTKGDHESCANDGECAGGFFCTITQQGQPGKCQHFCGNNSHCPAGNGNQTCSVGLQGYQGPLLCTIVTSCDPLDQSTCQAPQGCYPSGNGSGACFPSNNKNDGDTCMYTNDCKPGSICAGNPQKCMKMCNLNAGQQPSCDAGKTCQQVQGQNFGVCN